MATNRKPRKVYRPRPVDADPFGLAASRAAALGPRQRLHFIEPVAGALLALKRGAATMRTLAALDVHRVQVNHCSQGEMATAIHRAAERGRQALAGNAPRGALVCVGGLPSINRTTEAAT